MREINVNRLTCEAEAGFGSAVRAELDTMPFQQRIRTLHKMQELSACHHRLEPDEPYMTFSAQARRDGDYACLELYRHVPHNAFFGLMESSNEIYTDLLNLRTADEAVMSTNCSSRTDPINNPDARRHR